jgi:branched-chain amino acid aminotransferase
MHHVEARRAARAAGADAALLLTVSGDVAESDAANVFAVSGGRLVTPPLDRGVLPGITRALVLRTVRARGAAAEERHLPLEELLAASEVFVTSSLAGVRGVASIGARTFPAPGPCTLAAANAVEAVEAGVEQTVAETVRRGDCDTPGVPERVPEAGTSRGPRQSGGPALD